MAVLSQELLEVLACPLCKSKLSFNEKQSNLTCSKCRRIFKVRDGIPILLVDDAQS